MCAMKIFDVLQHGKFYLEINILLTSWNPKFNFINFLPLKFY